MSSQLQDRSLRSLKVVSYPIHDNIPKLAVYSPHLGALSETFIKKHMEYIVPGNTAVIAGSAEPPYCGHWAVDCPTLILSNKESVYPTKRKNKWLTLLYDKRKKIWLTLLHAFNLRSKNDLYYNAELTNFLLKNNIKVILGEFLDYSTTIIELAKKLNIKLYVHAHGYDVSARLKQPFWKKEYLRLNKIAGIITMSEYSKQKLIKSGLRKELIHVIPYGIDLPAEFEKAGANKYIKCLAVGRMVNKKAPLLLLESFMLASKKNDLLKLDFVGTGLLYNEALQYVKEFELEDVVTLHGALPHNSVINMMKDADIFLQHSVTSPKNGDQEGLPVAILEAMAYYLPVISTFHAGIPEAIVNFKNGLLVNEGNTRSMAEAILNLSDNENLRISMGKAGRNLFEKNFTWDKEKKSLLKLLNEDQIFP